MSAVLEARAVITAEDKTAGAFASLENRIKSVSGQAKALGSAMASVGRVSPQMAQVTGSITRARTAAEAFGTTTRTVDAVSAAVSRAAKTMPKLSAEAEALARTTRETAEAGQRFATEIGRIDAAANRLTAFKALQTGFGDARRAYFGAKETVEAFDRKVAESDSRLVALRQRHAIAQAASARAWREAQGVPGPDRADAADPAKFKAAHEARIAALAPYSASLAERKEIAAEIEAEASANKALRRQYEAAQDDAKRLGGALNQQRDALVAVRREVEALAGGPMRSLAGAEADLRAQAEGVNRAMLAQAQAAHRAAEEAHASAERRMRRREMLHAAGEAASDLLPLEGPEILHLTREAAAEGARIQHERVGLQNAGRTPEEREDIERRAREVSGALPTATTEDNLKVVAETTSAFGTLEHALQHLKFMQQSMSVLKAAGGEHIRGSAGDVGRDFAKFFEERLTKPENFEDEAKQMIPAMVASGGTFNPHEMYMFAQQAKSALPNYDMHFLSRIAPSLITAMGGERAGTAANAFNSIIMGKVNDKKQAEAWIKAGLLDPSKVIMKAGHAVGWQAGAVQDTDLALRDPLAWVEKNQLPALQKMGVDLSDRLAVAKALGTMYRNQNGNLWATELTQEGSRARLHKDAGLYDKVGSADDIYRRNLHEDPTVALPALGDAIKNFGSIVTAPAMKDAANVLGTTAEAIAHFSQKVGDFAAAHPQIAEAGGTAALAAGTGLGLALTYKLLAGFGSLLSGGGGSAALVGAAAQLDGSAAALETAAAALRGAAAAEAGGGLPGGATPVAKEAERDAAGFGRKLLSGLAYAGPIAAAGAFVGMTLLNRDQSKSLIDGGRPDVIPSDNNLGLPGLENDPDLPSQAPVSASWRAPDAYGREARARATPSAPLPPTRPDALGGVPSAAGPVAVRIVAGGSGSSHGEIDGPDLPPGRGGQSPLPAAGPIPVKIVGTVPASLPTRALPPGMHPDFTLGNGTGGFTSPGLGAGSGFAPFPGHQAPAFHADAGHAAQLEASPHVDLSGLDEAHRKVDELVGALTGVGNTTVAPKVSATAVDTLIAKLLQAKSLMADIGAGGGGTTGSVGPSRIVSGPGVGRSR